VLDVGSGAGLPGIPLAVARPEWRFVLLDASAKKTRFIAQAAAELGLANVEAVHARAEQFRPAQPFDTVLARAFGSIAAMLDAAGAHAARGGRLLALKGAWPEAELRALPAGYRVEAVEPLRVPGLRERHVVIMTRVTG
jgi:16S rRNA (guanine527-N7)-methyltransferase